MKPLVVAIAGSALLFLCLGNTKQPTKKQTASKRSGIVNTIQKLRK
jgi:hypothetical protein